MISLRKLRQPSLFKRLLAWQALVMLLAVGANFGWNIWLAYQPKTGSIDRSMYLLADAVARFAALDPAPAHAAAVAREVKQLDKDNATLPTKDTDFAWQVWRMSGQLLSSDGMDKTFALTPPGSLMIGIRHDIGDWRLMAAQSPDGKVWVVGHPRAGFGFLRLAFVNLGLFGFLFLLGQILIDTRDLGRTRLHLG